jgi:hypothetical protein
MNKKLIPLPIRRKLRAIQKSLDEFRQARDWTPSIGIYYPNARNGASFSANTLYDRVKAGVILGYETIISASGDDLHFYFRRKVY